MSSPAYGVAQVGHNILLESSGVPVFRLFQTEFGLLQKKNKEKNEDYVGLENKLMKWRMREGIMQQGLHVNIHRLNLLNSPVSFTQVCAYLFTIHLNDLSVKSFFVHPLKLLLITISVKKVVTMVMYKDELFIGWPACMSEVDGKKMEASSSAGNRFVSLSKLVPLSFGIGGVRLNEQGSHTWYPYMSALDMVDR